MKMTKPAFDTLKAGITPLDTPERRQAYREGRFRNADKTKNLDMRYRWDLYWLWWDTNNGALDLNIRRELYNMESEHTDTALRKIVHLFTTDGK